ncbi:MAG: hypothetical protein U9Q99_00065, partial [Nanoarchaeota archaeon]|nr:hypothetical protein [Nanoarchaeota archaeon]
SGKVVIGEELLTDSSNFTNTLKVIGDANITGYVYSKNQVAQVHREANITAGAIDTWYNLTWDLEVADETTNGWYNLTDSNSSVTVVGFDGIVRVQGCLHPYNDNIGNQIATIYARVLVNGIEARCLQASTTKEFKSSATDILPYIGTVRVKDGDVINVQWRTTNTNLMLKGKTIFDNPVSASVNFERISGLDE